jgi:hypothetical protein
VVLTMAILGVTGHLARVLVLEQGHDADTVAESVIAFCRNGYVADPVHDRVDPAPNSVGRSASTADPAPRRRIA